MNLLKRFRHFGQPDSRRRPRRAASRQSGRVLLRLEPLEDRLVLSDGTSIGTVLVRDINPGSGGSSLQNLTDLNGTLLFGADDGTAGGSGLWKSDGTTTGTVLVKDVGAGPFTVVGSSALLPGWDAAHGNELWKTDGTTAGTVLVKDINPGPGDSHVGNMANVNGTLFFNAYDPAHGFELWKSDGTEAGTVLVKDINPGGGWSFPANLTNVNGTLYFVASDGTAAGSGLMKSDGTAAGTVLVKNLGGDHLTNVNGTLFFTADDGKNGQELWKSDGTANGTMMIKDIFPGTFKNTCYYSRCHGRHPYGSSPDNLVNVNGTLFFTAYDGTHGRELWKSDGTSKGTVLVSDVNPGQAAGSYPGALTNVNGTLFFSADDGRNGQELWKSNGSAAGTILVKDINPGGFRSHPANLINANGTLYFAAEGGTTGTELWRSDGTAAGTVLVKDIHSGSAGSDPTSLTLSGGHLFFSADDGVHGRELWDPPVSSSLAGTAFEDLTANGVSADDATVPGRVIHLFRDNGDGAFNAGADTLVGKQTTGRDGGYQFRQLSAGTYFVQQDLPVGWVQTVPQDIRKDEIIRPSDCGQAPRERNDTLATAVATGLSSAAPGTYVACGEIGDNNQHVLDVDLFRVQANAGDVIRADVDAEAFGSPLDGTLRLFDAAGIQVASSTDVGDVSDPFFEFVAKATGTYYVGVSGAFNSDYDAAVEGSGTLAVSTGAYTLQIDVGPRPGAKPVVVTLAAGEARTGVDLAASRLGSISGQMFEDLDGDGVHDANEPGLDGWRLALEHAGGLFSATVTRAIDLNHDGRIDPSTESGRYSFDDLRPGSYFVRGSIGFGIGPAGWTQVTPSLDRPALPCIGQVSGGPGSDPGPGLVPDLTVDLVHGLCDRFQVGNELHFGQATPNLGLGPMELRAGADLGNGTQIVNQRIYLDASLTTYYEREAGTFTFHPEHNHIHFDDYATYALRQALPDSNGDGLPEVGAVVTGGQKTSFCLVDVAPYDLTLPNAAQQASGFGCGTAQRISVGWEDVYDPLTVGQQIDVGSLAPGQYWLEAVVDPDNHLLESNESNNTGRALISVGPGGPDAPLGAHGVQLRSGQVVAGKDFANFRVITISGQVFNDQNANGKQDNKEHGLDGWVVFLDRNGDGVLNNPEGDGLPTALAKEPWAITDNQGNYVFAGVGAGTLLIRLVPQAGWRQTTSDPAPIAARSGQNVSGVDFGNTPTGGGGLTAAGLGSGTADWLTADLVRPLLAAAVASGRQVGLATSPKALGAMLGPPEVAADLLSAFDPARPENRRRK